MALICSNMSNSVDVACKSSADADNGVMTISADLSAPMVNSSIVPLQSIIIN